MRLKKLETKDISAFVSNIYRDNMFPKSFIDKLTNQCEGNPFFITEILRQMDEEGSVVKQDGKYIIVKEEYSIPDTVEEVIHSRLDLLEPDAMTIAEYASCEGREFKTKAALSIHTLADPNLAFSKVQEKRVVVQNNGTSEFIHAIFHNIIYMKIGNRWKSSYHKSLGEYYESVYGDRLDEVMYELARHYSRSNDSNKAFMYCLWAAEKAESAFAPEQSIEFYKGALTELKHKSDRLTYDKVIEILERLGDLHTLNGDYDEAIQNYRSTIEKEKDEAKKADLHRKIAQVYEKIGEYDKSMEEIDIGLALLKGKECIVISRLMSVRGLVHTRRGDYDDAIKALQVSVDIANGLHYEKEAADAEHNIGNVGLFRHDYKIALKHYDKAMETREKISDLEGKANTLNNIGIINDYIGELDKALECYKESLEIREKIGDKLGIEVSLNNIGISYMNKGEFQKALDYYERSLEIKKKLGHKSGIAMVLNNIGLVHCDRGEPDKALEYYQKALEISMKIGDKMNTALFLNNFGNAYSTKNEPDKALEYFGKGLEICLEIGEKWGAIKSYRGLAMAGLGLKDGSEVLENAERALEIAVEIGATAEEGRCHRALAIIYRENKDWQRSLDKFDEAFDVLDKAGDKEGKANAFYERSKLWNMMGKQEKMRSDISRTLQMALEIGMDSLADKCSRELEALGSQ